MIDKTTNDRDSLDDAIDRTLREMTHLEIDDDGVARVMARVRAAGVRERRTFAPRLAWAGAAALLLVAIAAVYSLRSSHPEADVRRVAVTAPPQPSKPPIAAREIPTPAMSASSTSQATTARHTHGRVVKPSSVAHDAADASRRRRPDVRPELPPLESDIAIADIAPAPLGDALSIDVAPLITPSLAVDAIPVPSIDMPPVGPESQR